MPEMRGTRVQGGTRKMSEVIKQMRRLSFNISCPRNEPKKKFTQRSLRTCKLCKYHDRIDYKHDVICCKYPYASRKLGGGRKIDYVQGW